MLRERKLTLRDTTTTRADKEGPIYGPCMFFIYLDYDVIIIVITVTETLFIHENHFIKVLSHCQGTVHYN